MTQFLTLLLPDQSSNTWTLPAIVYSNTFHSLIWPARFFFPRPYLLPCALIFFFFPRRRAPVTTRRPLSLQTAWIGDDSVPSILRDGSQPNMLRIFQADDSAPCMTLIKTAQNQVHLIPPNPSDQTRDCAPCRRLFIRVVGGTAPM